MLPNLWQDNFVTGAFPLIFQPLITALPDVSVPFQNTVVPVTLPTVYNTQGNLCFPAETAQGGAQHADRSATFSERSGGAHARPSSPVVHDRLIARNFRNGYIGSWTAGIDHDFRGVKLSAAYVAPREFIWPASFSPNSYGGADPAFAPFTQFNSAGQATGGFGPEAIMTSGSHSTYHSLQTSVSKNSARIGLGLQASYTYSKSIDDTSAVLGGLPANAGVILQTLPQNPWNPEAEKGPSTFDVTHVFSLSVIQLLPLDRMSFLQPLGEARHQGLAVSEYHDVTSGPPFTVYSGIQQTGVGAGGTDRPGSGLDAAFFDQPRGTRGLFRAGREQRSFFSIPINVPGGTGPNHGRFGTLGRNTFRGPGFHDFDMALIKDTPFGHRGNGEMGIVEFRAEFFNIFNIVNFGLPSNIVRGSGFGIISKTAGTSRQIQFSLKLIY